MIPGLTTLLGARRGDLVAFVGAGGKTRLMLGLGRELSDAGLPVLMTTTTRMGVEEIPPWARLCHTPGEVQIQLSAGSPAFLIGAAGVEKISGVDPDLVAQIHAATSATVLVEADGAQHRAFKAPAAHEPAIPPTASLVVVVAGLNALGRRIEEVCHRPELVAALARRSTGDPLRAEDMARVLSNRDGGLKGVPPESRVTIALTMATADNEAAIGSIRSAVTGRVAVVPAGR